MTDDVFSAVRSRVWSVSELVTSIKGLVESGMPLLWLRGEISNLTRATSGHWYFSLKDASAQMRCVMFRQHNQRINDGVNNGQAVELLGTVTLYEPRGDLQFTVTQLRPAGAGDLFERYTRLKQQLESEGLFQTARKRVLPAYPKCVGIVTSPQAAALRDVLTTLRQRWPAVPVVLYPAPVQGAGSAARLAGAIETANRRAECDVLILCRGGGSLEDLWAFNEEVLARAIAASGIPVISGVGHETDFTIADFVADERAATPTAAAQRVVPDCRELMQRIEGQGRRLQQLQQNYLSQRMQTVDFLQRRLLHPSALLQREAERLQQWQRRLLRGLIHARQQQDWRWQLLLQRFGSGARQLVGPALMHQRQGHRLVEAMERVQSRYLLRLEAAAQRLDLLDPRRVLARGYSLVRDANGHVVVDAQAVSPGDRLNITLAHGALEATVNAAKSPAPDTSAAPD
jgi:exodeoxyribonuclease VII large subunit